MKKINFPGNDHLIDIVGAEIKLAYACQQLGFQF
jgi:hypothetical protein